MDYNFLNDEVIGWVNGNPIHRELTIDEFNDVLSLLDHKKTRIRWQAAHKLGKFGDPTAVPALIKLLDEPDGEIRYRAIKTLGTMRDLRAVKPIKELLMDPEEKVRGRAKFALRQLFRWSEWSKRL